MTSKKSTNRLLKKLKLSKRERDLDDLSDDSDEEIRINPNDLYNGPIHRQFSTDGAPKFAKFELNSLSNDTAEHENNFEHNLIPINETFTKHIVRPIETSIQIENITKLSRKRLKFGTNEHPYLNVWLTLLAITGAPVLPSFANWKDNRLRMILSSGISLVLLVAYHLLFLNSTVHLLNSLPSSKGLHNSVWLQIYPIFFNLAVVIVADVMWFTGLGNNCWMNDVIDCFREIPPDAEIVKVKYNYFDGEHEIINNVNQEKIKKINVSDSQLKLMAVYMWKLTNFIMRQLLAFGCCFTYLYVSYHLLKPVEFNMVFVLKLVNIFITCSAWLTILWIYMTLCQVLCWRFRDFNDVFWHFRRHEKLPDLKQFCAFSTTYEHYLKNVKIVDNFFKYWIVAIFGVLFFQTSLYFQYVINAFTNWPPSLQLLSIPLITMPFMSSLLVLIKRAADVNAESKQISDIIVEICLHCKNDIPDNLYKKIQFFLMIVSEGSSLTFFGLVKITKHFLVTAIVIIFSYTRILHGFTRGSSISETIKNNITSLE